MTQQFRNFTIRLYSESKQNVLNLCTNFNHYAFILHDKDRYNDESEDHEKGDMKKAHYHICANFARVQSKKAVLKLVEKYIPHASAFVQPMQDPKGAFNYLTHSTEQAKKDNKHPYNSSEIISDKPTFWHEKEVQEQVKRDKEDWTVVIYDRLSDGQPIGLKEYTEYVHKYGRDFILNYRRVHEFCEFIHTVGDHNA